MKEQVIREIDLDKRFKKKCWGNQVLPSPLTVLPACFFYFFSADISIHALAGHFLELVGKIIFRVAEPFGEQRDRERFADVQTDVVADFLNVPCMWIRLLCGAETLDLIFEKFAA